MMSKTCHDYQELLMDVFYGEREMDNIISKHLKDCQECQRYFDEMTKMQSIFKGIDVEVPIEYNEISQAFEKATVVKTKKKNLMSLIAFIMVSSIIIAGMIILAMGGYVKEILYSQIGLTFILPFLVPVMIKLRTVKEEYNE